MSVTLYASKDEIKNFLGISGSSKDLLIRQLARSMKTTFDGLIGVTGLESRTITDELQKNHEGENYFYVREFNPTSITGFKNMLGEAILATSLSNGDFTIVGHPSRKILAKYGLGYPEFKITYVAGWTCNATIQVTNYANLSAETITVGETVLTEGTDFNAVTSNSVTATNIATALTTAGINSTAVGDTVTIGIADDLSTSSSSAVTLTEADLPGEVKMAFAYMVGGAIAQREGLGGLASYTLGSKTVNFRTQVEKNEFKRVIEQMLPNFNRPIIVGA